MHIASNTWCSPVSAKGAFPHSVVAEVLGSAGVETLMAGGSVALGNKGVKMVLAYPATCVQAPANALFLAMHLTPPDIEKIDDLPTAAAIVYVPWLEDDGTDWLSTWQPITLGPSTWSPIPSAMSPQVMAALQLIQSSLNGAAGLLHPSDKKLAVTTFKTLQKDGHTMYADEIKRWAWSNGWGLLGVKNLVDISRKYQG
ncbi:hypothetical protein [Burkholderia sp. FL-7-2-10-S1-D7]|uniref:hypothetical protein n=1 Tax=Burkholderia sp. FL-7-2-10-S1-D7 TaxID=1637866 RepID=UPI0012E39CB2|nr:hypothetical protein [Burkholderia sp. FL-7-2-10-S1-D7]